MPSAEAGNSTTKATRGWVGAGHAHTCWAGSQAPATACPQRRGGRVLSPDLRKNTGKHKGRVPEPPRSKAPGDPDAVTRSPTGCHRAAWKSVALLFAFKDQTLILVNRFPPGEADLSSRGEQTAQLPGRGVLPTKQSGLAPRLRFLPRGSQVPVSPAQRGQRHWAQPGFLPVPTGLGVGGMNPHLHRRL